LSFADSEIGQGTALHLRGKLPACEFVTFLKMRFIYHCQEFND